MRKAFLMMVLTAVGLVLMMSAAALAQEGAISIEEAVICKDVVDRTPVEPGDVFPQSVERVYCFTKVVGATAGENITHNWYFGGNQMASVSLAVQSYAWRTYSSKRILPEWTGEWTVDVVAQDGTVLKKIIFLVQ